MPAPDLNTLFDPETALEEALKAALVEQGFNAYLQREDVEKRVPCITLKAAMNGQLRGNRIDPTTKKQWNVAWNFSVECGVTTARKATSQPVIHADMRSRLRLLMQPAAGLFTETHLPYHALREVIEVSSIPQILTEGDLDESTITFGGVLAIREDAWPE